MKGLLERAVAEAVSPSEIVSGYLVRAMTEVWARFECQEFYA